MIHEDEKQAEMIGDYVLDLLPTDARDRVESHLSGCAPCREAVGQERALAEEVRQTVARATRPAPGQLRRLMPAPPAQRARFPALTRGAWRPVAALALLLALFLGVFQQEFSGEQPALASPSATTLVATATTTPTATQIQPATAVQVVALPPDAGPVAVSISPPPAGTRLVALPARTAGP